MRKKTRPLSTAVHTASAKFSLTRLKSCENAVNVYLLVYCGVTKDGNIEWLF